MTRPIKFRYWDKENKQMFEAKHVWINSDDGTKDWMQFTNLHDKNGKEIYEGDIVEWVENFGGSDRIHRIQVEIPRIYRTIWDDPGLIFEVIGNIYENPELLK